MDYVLIVEDELLIALNVQEVLERAGFRPRMAGNGQEALAQLEVHGAPVFIVTDLQMPVMGGLELAVALKRDERWRDIPVFAMSGAQEMLAPAGAALFSGLLHKPFADDELVQCVKQAISERLESPHWKGSHR